MIGTFMVDCRSDDIDPMTKGMLMMWGVFAEMERDIISQRVKSGMVNAKAKGKKLGRPMTSVSNLPKKFWEYYGLYKEERITITGFAHLMNTSRATVYKYINIAESK